MDYYVYGLKDETGEYKYIGQTYTLAQRKCYHKNNKPEHTFVVLDQFNNIQEACGYEIELIQKYSTYMDGWNKTPGGEGSPNYSRKGIGGQKKGCVTWNKGKSGCFSKETIQKMKENRSGIYWGPKKDYEKIWEHFNGVNFSMIDGVGCVLKNGKILTKERYFAKKYYKDYGYTSSNGLCNLLEGKTWNGTTKHQSER